MAELLRVDKVWAGYGDAVVLEDVSFSLAAGESLALLGRNGMGKTTLLCTLMGVTRLRRGTLQYDGADITRMPSYRRAQAGLGWVPQERDIFPSLTVEENLTTVAQPGDWTLERVYQMFPRLKERRGNMGDELSGGERQMLAMARALMLNPRILLLDEPLEGLAPLIAQELLQVIRQMMSEGNMVVILVEQHARQILPITRRALVLERGRIVYSGSSDDLLRDPELLDRWLGASGGAADDRRKEYRIDPNAPQRIPAIEIIHNEHTAIAAILNGLSAIVEGLEDGSMQPNFELLESMVRYIDEVPDKVHHPKENRIFALLRTKTRELDDILDKLDADHDVNVLADRLELALAKYKQGGDAAFPQFRNAVRSYVADEWAHMGTEARHVLPAARRLFTAEDWAPINADFLRNSDPWSGPNKEYSELFRRITHLAPAPIGVGGTEPARQMGQRRAPPTI